MKTIEGNKLIAEFMNVPIDIEKHYWVEPNEVKYHSSWDWLMPVVQKIGEIEIIKAGAEGCELYDNIDYALRPAKIEAVWLAVVEFIEWYNQNKSS